MLSVRKDFSVVLALDEEQQAESQPVQAAPEWVVQRFHLDSGTCWLESEGVVVEMARWRALN